jgi:hypothetical protein
MAGMAVARLSVAQPRRGWRRETPMPVGAQEIYPAMLSDRVHVAGGFTMEGGQLAVTDVHQVFDPATGTWARAASLPEIRHHPNIVSDGRRLFALGGFLAASERRTWIMQDQTWIYDPLEDGWTEGTRAPEPHAETVAAHLETGIHVVGGRRPIGASNRAWRDHTDSQSHWVYETDRDRWRAAAPAPTARNSAAAAVIDGHWYVVGGRTVAMGNVATTEVYDPGQDRWTTGAPMPQAQGGLAAAALDGRLYAFGGEGARNDTGVYSECWVYDPTADRWDPIAAMPTPRHGLGAVTIGGRIYVVGGATRAGAAGTSGVLESFG